MRPSPIDDWVIDVPKWEVHQHYKDQTHPPWIKLYVRLLTDPQYLQLTLAQQGLLTSIWLVRSRMSRAFLVRDWRVLRACLAPDSRHLRANLISLNHAGFIVIDSRAEVEVEVEVEVDLLPKSPKRAVKPSLNGTTPAGRKRDLHWDAFISAGLPKPETSSERGRWNKALKILRDAGVEPEQIVPLCTAYRTKWPRMDITPTAVAANLSLLKPARELTYEEKQEAFMRSAREREREVQKLIEEGGESDAS